MAKKIKVEKTVSVDTAVVDTTAVVLTKQEINTRIDQSFYGDIANQELINHFSSINGDKACMDNYYIHCYAEKGWKRQGDISGKRKGSKAPAGHQAVQKWAAMILLSELSLWDENLTMAQRNKAVRDNWSSLRNIVAMKCFKNSSVANAMCSMRSDKKRKEEKAKVELQDQVEDTAEEVIKEAKKEETINPVEKLELIVEKLKAVKDVSELSALIVDLELLVSVIK